MIKINFNNKMGTNKKNIAVGGKTVYGGTVGVCMLDTQFPRIHGDIANARTWSVPVHYRVVPGATPKKPASGFIALKSPSDEGFIHAISSPTVLTFQPSKHSGGIIIAKFVFPQALGKAAPI